jgi:hypothetical protein
VEIESNICTIAFEAFRIGTLVIFDQLMSLPSFSLACLPVSEFIVNVEKVLYDW